jgi:hypothetical protein
MDERWYIFDDLSPEEALRMLATLVFPSEEFLVKNIRIKLERGAFGCLVSLLFPCPHMERGRADKIPAKVEFLSSMKEFYEEIKRKEPAYVPQFKRKPGSELEKGLIGLILNSLEDEENDPAPIVEDETMVVSRYVTAGEAAEQFHHIRLHASYSRMAEADSTLTNEHYYLFHVKEDKERKSTFQSIIETGILEYGELLNCFEEGEYRLFLPEKHTHKSGSSTSILPGAAALGDFCKILLHLRGGDAGALPTTPRALPLAAICPVDSVGEHDSEGGSIYDLIILSKITWRSHYDPHLRPVEVEDYQVHQLVDSKNEQQALRPAIAEMKSNVGYRLELRQINHDWESEGERERVKEKLLELEHRLEYLNGALMPRWQIYRFNGRDQLRALADRLRTYHIKSLEQEAILYGFQSNRHHPEGVHYLFVDASRAVEVEGITGSMRYQVDPLWAQHYLQHSSDTLVYVPEGCTLYPPIHDWEAEGSDGYLREIMSSWFPSQGGIPEIPKKPIYIFDGKAGPGCRISITVLDKESFVPIKQVVSWINDHLQIYESYQIEDIIPRLASSAERKQLKEKLEAESDEIITTLEAKSEKMIAKSNELIEKACQEIVANAESLLEGYNAEIPEFIEIIKKTHKTINMQKARVDALSKQQSEIERFLSETEQGINAVDELTKRAKTEIPLLRGRVATAISESDTAVRELEEIVGKRITLLEDKKSTLLKQLKKAHRIFSN